MNFNIPNLIEVVEDVKKKPFYAVVFKEGEAIGKYGVILLKHLPDKILKNNRRYRWGLFKCTCGKEWESTTYNIYVGNSKSCGCLKTINPSNIKHNKGNQKGRPYSYMYGLWINMNARCYIKSCKSYLSYGAKGITVFEEWKNNYQLFENDILSLIGERPSTNHQLDRIDGNEGYYPENLRWEDKAKPFLNKANNILSEEDVKEIKWLLSLGKFTSADIARDYKVPPDHVSKIKADKIHKLITI